MEVLKELEGSLKRAISEIKGLDSKYSIREGDIQGLEAQKGILEKDISELQAKKAEIVSFIGMAESNLKKEYEAKERDLKTKNDQLDAERGRVKGLEIQAELKAKAADESKERCDKLYSEYQEKIDAINKKREAVLEALKNG